MKNNIQKSSMKSKISSKINVSKDLIYASIFFFISIFSVYFLPKIVNQIIFFIFIIAFATTKKDYFFLAIWFAFLNQPGNFFSITLRDATNQLPLYSFGPFSFSIFDFFMLISIAKAIVKKHIQKNHFIKIFIILFMYLIFVTIPITYIYETSKSMYSIIRELLYLTLVFTLPILIKNEKEFFRFGYIVSLFIFPILINQLYTYTTGNLIVNLIDHSNSYRLLTNSITGGLRVLDKWSIIPIFTLYFSLMLMYNKKYQIFSFVSEIILILSSLIIILTQTRSNFLILLIIISLLFYYKKLRVMPSLIKMIVISLLLIGILFIASTSIYNNFFSEYLSRQTTMLQAALNNNLLNYDTVGRRINFDLNNTLSEINKNPLFGIGFSEMKWIRTSDWGLISSISVIGLFGIIIIINIFIKGFSLINKKKMIIHKIILISIFVLYLLTWEFFFSIYQNRTFLFMIIITIINIKFNANKE